MKHNPFIRQNPKRHFRSVAPVSSTGKILRPANHHFDLVKSNIVDGCSTSSGLFDEVAGDCAEVFDYRTSKFDLANSLLERGASLRDASSAASGGSADSKNE